MEHLPPVGWADVATKRDLDHLHTLMQRDLSDLRGEMFDRMSGQTRTLVFSFFGAVVSLTALTLTAVRIG